MNKIIPKSEKNIIYFTFFIKKGDILSVNKFYTCKNGKKLKKVIGIGVALTLLSSAIVVLPLNDTPVYAAIQDDRNVIVYDTNDARSANRLAPLKKNSALDNVAQAWADKIGKEDRLYHNPNVGAQIPAGWNSWGENVAQGYSSADVVNAWLASPGHKANIMNNGFTDIGVGYTYADGRMYSVQVFATYKNSTPPATNAPTPTPTVTKTVPAKPNSVNATAVDSTSINATWAQPTTNGNSPITGYDVRIIDTTTKSVITKNTSATVLNYKFTGLKAGTYIVEVVAKNSIGKSATAASKAVTIKVTPPPIVTTVPSQVAKPIMAPYGSKSVKVSWLAPKSNGNTKITGYKVALSENGKVLKTITTANLNNIFTGLQSGTNYSAQVVAVNAVGSSVNSVASNVVKTAVGVPNAPATPKITLPKKQNVTVQWTAPFNGGSNITSYIVTLKNKNGQTVTKEVSAKSLQYSFTGVKDDSIYTATVVAKNAIGKSVSSPSSATIKVPKNAARPNAPREVKVTNVKSTSAVVNWKAGADNGAPITGYNVIIYNTKDKAVYNKWVSSTTYKLSIPGLSKNTTYRAVVTAKNSQGTSNKNYSGYFKTLR
jgi:hypothetical protein